MPYWAWVMLSSPVSRMISHMRAAMASSIGCCVRIGGEVVQLVGVGIQVIELVLIEAVEDILHLLLPEDALGVEKALPVTFGKGF